MTGTQSPRVSLNANLLLCNLVHPPWQCLVCINGSVRTIAVALGSVVTATAGVALVATAATTVALAATIVVVIPSV